MIHMDASGTTVNVLCVVSAARTVTTSEMTEKWLLVR